MVGLYACDRKKLSESLSGNIFPFLQVNLTEPELTTALSRLQHSHPLIARIALLATYPFDLPYPNPILYHFSGFDKIG